MHKGNFDINMNNLSKIEGHADLDIKVEGNKVTDVKLRITENKRFFTNAVRGKPAIATHQLVSRICGTCSIAHLTCCIEAVEKAYHHVPSYQTLMLRHLSLYGLNIRDHAMHLYLFCLPDLFGKDSLLDFADEGYEHDLVHKAFDVKAAGNKLSTIVAGRAVHAMYPVPGNFVRIPKKEDLKAVAVDLKKVRAYALEFVDIFYKCNFEFKEQEPEYIAIKNDDFSYLGDQLCSTRNYCIPEEQFANHLTRNVIPYSQALGFKFEGKTYIVGALARMNLNGGSLHRKTREDVGSAFRVFPSDNIYHNNLAQAIEIVNCVDRSLDIIEELEPKERKSPVLKLEKDSEGVAAIEAPRGTLYYHLKINKLGQVTYANLVIPTAQNQISMEKNVARLVEQNLYEGKRKREIQYEIEKLIRAYDPCMSCATHFLRVNWL
ncbi:nickel-dependent hydrogenase large subunit [Candidatus Micrarchaeota archaeon]|nr:nickel-dependent hydrogenase large subunit [Candidatus Micrarchaeota archaeon]